MFGAQHVSTTSTSPRPRWAPLAIVLALLLQLTLVASAALRSAACTFPDVLAWPHNATGPFPALDRQFTCAPGSLDARTAGSRFSLPGAAAGFPPLTYVDGRATVYDNAPEASFVGAVRPVRAALLSAGSTPALPRSHCWAPW